MKFAMAHGRTWAALAAALLAPLVFAFPARGQDAAALAGDRPPEGAIWLDSLDVTKMTSGWDEHPALAGKSIEGKPLTLQGVVYRHGIGTHARSDMVINLNGAAKRFVSMVGVDDEK